MIYKSHISLVVIIGLAFILTMCEHEPVEPVQNPLIKLDTLGTSGESPWDSINWKTPSDSTREIGRVYFENDILKLMVTKCAMYEWTDYTFDGKSETGCHGSEHAQNGVILDNYDGIKDIVEVKNANDSKLYQEILNPDIDKKMPPQQICGTLTPKEIDNIAKWINDGAKEDRCYPCDTINPRGTWANVQKIIYNNCSGCHNQPLISNMDLKGQKIQSSFFLKKLNHYQDLVDYDLVKNNFTRILSRISHYDDNKVMPLKIGRLYKCEVEELKLWQENNFPN